MKHITILIVIILAYFTSYSQNAKVDGSGNYVAIKAVKTAVDNNKPTGRTFTDAKGAVYPVLESAKGKLFYVKTSAAGNQYKVYIKL